MFNYFSIDLLYVKCVYYYFKCVGLVTMTVSFKSSTENKKLPYSVFAPSKIGILPNLVLIFTVIGTQFYTIKVAFQMDNLENSVKFDRMVETIRLTFGASSSVFILVLFCTNQAAAINIANNIKKISVLSVNLSTKTVNQKEAFFVCRATGGIFLVHILIWSLIYIMTPWNLGIRIYYVSLNIFELIITSTFLQYSILLKIVRRILKIINANILDIFRDSNAVDIHVLKELHISVCDIAESLGRFYSIPILLCITYEFISLTFYFYYVTKILLEKYHEVITSDTFCFYGFGILHYIVPLIDLIGSASAVIGEGEKTVELINRWIEPVKDQEQGTVRLNHFSHYLAQKKLKFTAGGLFSLDGSLILSIAGSITTYLMILLQFEGIKPGSS